MNGFTVEESNLICCYLAATKEDTEAAITDALPLMDGEMRELAERSLEKLRTLTGEDFSAAGFTPADEEE